MVRREVNAPMRQVVAKRHSALGVLAGITAPSVGFLYGYDMSSVAGALRHITAEFHLSMHQQELVTSAAVVGEIAGAVVGGALANAIGNDDLLMHLATGRLIAQGEYSIGADPFLYTTTRPWIHHAWLFDLTLFLLTGLAGGIESPGTGVILIGLKALLAVFLAIVLMQTRRVGLGLLAPAVCTMLALLALSPALELQPRIASLLFLAITLCLLTRARTRPSPT